MKDGIEGHDHLRRGKGRENCRRRRRAGDDGRKHHLQIHRAPKCCRIYGGKVVTGFAGTVSDAFALCERFEAKLEQFSGNLERAAVELAQEWRADKAMRKLEAMLIVASGDQMMIVSGTGEVIVPDDGVAAVGSGGNYAMAAARALRENTAPFRA